MNRLGPEDYQSNRHIRKILNLAEASRGDVFYDLGCGRGQLCVVAVAEFGVKRAVGMEPHRGRAAKAAERIQEMGLTDRIEVRNGLHGVGFARRNYRVLRLWGSR